MRVPICNGCPELRTEEWPHGMTAARCMSRGETGGTIRAEGRTLELFGPAARMTGVGLPAVVRPVWCPRKEGEK